MTTTIDTARDAAERAAVSDSDRLLERLAELVGAKATVRAVFGEPIRQGDLLVVPVARVRWGFGGGGGRSAAAPTSPASGSGGGGGVAAEPVGFLEVGPAGATFNPIADVRPSPAFIIAAGITAAIVIRALARLLRR